jgi:hypothetical protein
MLEEPGGAKRRVLQVAKRISTVQQIVGRPDAKPPAVYSIKVGKDLTRIAAVIHRLKRRARAREVAIFMAPRPNGFETPVSWKAQPQEASLVVVVIQLQQSQPTTLAV